ncbi:MAG: ATP-binding cassette domain-containing protein, partial [Acidobacteriota bacterium]
MTPLLSIRDLRLRRGAREILRGVTLDVSTGEIVALMGLSGAGKTTVLRVVAGLEATSPRELQCAGRVGMVFQFHHLFEHLSVVDNVCL